MSFINPLELGRSAVSNIKNMSWDVDPCYNVYQDEGKALVEYVQSLADENKELKAKLAETEKEN